MDNGMNVKLLIEKFEGMRMRNVQISGAPRDWNLKAVTGRVAETVAKIEHNILPFSIGTVSNGGNEIAQRWLSMINEKMINRVQKQSKPDVNTDDTENTLINLTDEDMVLNPIEVSSNTRTIFSSHQIKTVPSFSGFTLDSSQMQFVRATNSCTW